MTAMNTEPRKAEAARVIPMFKSQSARAVGPSGGSAPVVKDAMLEAIEACAKAAGGLMLFEVPSPLPLAVHLRAAAIATGDTGEILFVVFDPINGELGFLSPAEVPGAMHDLAHSYAGVLSLIASGS